MPRVRRAIRRQIAGFALGLILPGVAAAHHPTPLVPAPGEGAAPADEPPGPLTLDELTRRADHVVLGFVRPSAAAGSRVVAQEYLKSRTFEPQLTLRPRSDGGRAVEAGERVLLFLTARERDVAIVGGWQGAFRVRDGVATQAESGRRWPVDELTARVRGIVAVPPPAYGGTLLLHEPVEELGARADLVMTGRVESLHARFTPAVASIETDVTLRVDRALKGAPPARLTLTIPGGTVGDFTVQVAGVPIFWPGESVLVFVNARAGGFVLAGLWQGKYSLVGGHAVQPETGARVRLEHLVAGIQRGPATGDRGGGGPALVDPRFTTFCSPWSAEQMPIAMFVNPANPGTGAPGGAPFVTLVQEALQTWQDVAEAWAAGGIAGLTGRNASDHFDGHHDVAWADLDPYGPGVVGVNFCTSFRGVRLDSDTQFDNTGRVWSITAAPNTVDLITVARHELGHAFGLGHSAGPCDAPASPVMCPSIPRGARKALHPDDVAGLVTLYPLHGAPPAPPTGVRAGAVGARAVELAWNPSPGALGHEIQRAREGCGGPFVVLNTVPAQTAGHTDDGFGDGVSPGTYCYRLKALGQGGDSVVSDAAIVHLGGATTGCSSATARGLDAGYEPRRPAGVAVFRGVTAQWFIRSSSGALTQVCWGSPALGDVAIPADYDGDGTLDLAVFRRTSGEWVIRRSSDGGTTALAWGNPALGDRPVPADYDGDGRADIAVFRQSTGEWFIGRSGDGTLWRLGWGSAALGDQPVPADYDGDGRADVAVFRPATGEWFIRTSAGGALRRLAWGSGAHGDGPVPADYDADGRADVAVFRQATGEWFIHRSADGALLAVPWGSPTLGDVPVPGATSGVPHLAR